MGRSFRSWGLFCGLGINYQSDRNSGCCAQRCALIRNLPRRRRSEVAPSLDGSFCLLACWLTILLRGRAPHPVPHAR